ncbi:MAG TPA: SDR family oxidoreductase [Acidimicrobiales bacterium]|nr:SDR family oxidoreductase [Acidimicrobiales bacterium]
MRVAVAGGTGTVGRHITQACRDAGLDVTVLSRRTGTDLTTGEGLDRALDGVEVVIDASNGPALSEGKATAFFEAVTRNLHRSGQTAGVRRLLAISIVNIDKLTGNPYYRAKLAHERVALEGPLPASIIRATQFHEFPVQIMQRSKVGPVAMVPDFRVQTVAARAVGEVVAEIVLDSGETVAPGSTVDVAGPDVAYLPDLARRACRRLGWSTRVVPVPVPGRTGRSMRRGGLTPEGPARIVGPAFDDWLGGDDVFLVGT